MITRLAGCITLALIVASTIITALEELDLSFPDVDKAKKKELENVRGSLLNEKD